MFSRHTYARSTLSRPELAGGLGVLLAISACASVNYLVFHSLVELLCIVVAATVATVALTAYRTPANHYITLIGMAFACVAFLDSLHMLSYRGMQVFVGYDYYAPQFWLAARLVQASSMLLGVALIGSPHQLKPGFALSAFVIATAAITASILYFHSFPVCFAPGQGFTPFKSYSECGICGLFVVALLILRRRRHLIAGPVYQLLSGSLVMAAAMELCFTWHASDLLDDTGNLVGHLAKAGSFLLLYKAVVVTAIRNPMDLLFRDLQDSHDGLRAAKEAAERDYRQERLLMGAIVESSEDAIFTFNSAGAIMNWNAGAERLFGYPRAEIAGQPVARLVPGDYAQPWNAWIDQVSHGVAVSSRDLMLAHRDGRSLDVSVTLSPLSFSDGKAPVASVIVRDTTIQRAAERALARDQQRLATILRTASDGIHILDRQGRLIQANDAFLSMLGYDASWVGRLNVCDWDTVSDWPEIKQRNDALIAARSRTVFETVHRHRDGHLLNIEISAVGIEIEGEGFLYAASRDITERKRTEQEIRNLAFYDALTGLPNRRLLMDRLQHAAVGAPRNHGHLAMLFIDLDNFKYLNDSAGHDIGDLLLRKVAVRISSGVGEADTVARLGGDEFVVMLAELSADTLEAAHQARSVAERILGVLSGTYDLNGFRHHVSASIGITLLDRNGESFEEPLKRADLAMYEAKNAGRNTIRFYDPQMQAVVTARAALEVDLRQALALGQFTLHYQPQVATNGRVTGVEALIRWNHPLRGLVMPGEFIGLAEETGLILPLGRWVIEAACRQLVAWSSDPLTSKLPIAINVSGRQFQQAGFVAEVLAILRTSGARPDLLKIELTESLLLQDVESVIQKMHALKREGIGLSLDDFGTGYSSLAVLKSLPLDQLKIDGTFVRDILTDGNDAAIARMVIGLADNLGLVVIAECVEHPAQRDFLISQGCDVFQGYLFGRPMSAEAFRSRLLDSAAGAVIGTP